MDLVHLVDFVEHGGQRGRLAAARAAGHKNQPVLFLDDLAEHRRQVERVHGRNFRLETAHHHRMIPILAVDVDAKAAKILQRITAIARATVGQILDQSGIFINDGPSQTLDARTGEHGFGRFEGKRLEPAVNFNLGRFAGHEKQIRDSLGALNHGCQQSVQFIGCCHIPFPPFLFLFVFILPFYFRTCTCGINRRFGPCGKANNIAVNILALC